MYAIHKYLHFKENPTVKSMKRKRNRKRKGEREGREIEREGHEAK